MLPTAPPPPPSPPPAPELGAQGILAHLAHSVVNVYRPARRMELSVTSQMTYGSVPARMDRSKDLWQSVVLEG